MERIINLSKTNRMSKVELESLNRHLEKEELNSIFPKSSRLNALENHIITIEPFEKYQIILRVNEGKLKGKWLKRLDKMGYLVDNEVYKPTARLLIFSIKRRHN